MPSNPLFLMEDQTDEDFFDKLVDDDFSPIEQPTSSTATQLKFDDGTNSDDARAFANLLIVDDIVAHGDDTLNEADPRNYAANGVVSSSPKKHDPLTIASESVQFVHIAAINLRDDGVTPKMDEMPQSETAKESNMIDGSESPGVKEVDWGSFCVDTSVRDDHGFGSYSDFFTELEGSAESLHGKDVAAGGILVSSDANNISFGLNNSARSDQHQDEVHHDYASRQYVDNSQFSEDLYPGWKCDASTGQWYQVGGHDASIISHESHGNSMKNWETAAPNNSDASYLEQSTKFTVGAVVEAGTVESVSSWNQAPQVGNGNPEHIVFDPRFPGWYYDTIAQNYYPLDSYNQASQATGQAYDQQAQNGYALTSNYSSSEDRVYDTYDKQPTLRTQEFGIQSHHGSWDQSYSSGNQQATKMWQSETVGRTEAGGTTTPLSSFRGNQQANSLYSTEAVAEHPTIAQTSQETSLEHFKPYQNGVQGFIPQHVNGASVPQNGPLNFPNKVYSNQEFVDVSQQSFMRSQLFSPTTGRSPDGRPPHALFSFGFGGKLIVMKDNNNLLHNSSFGSQGTGRNSFSVLNLSEVTSGSAHFSSLREDTLGYFRCLHQQSFPGPLVGGNVGSKELNKWLDERIVNCESSNMDSSRVKLLRLLLSLLKISCQYYGKLRSPFGTDTAQKEMDTAEAAVAKLFAFAKNDGIQSTSHINQCLQHLPPESQMQVTALEMQNLLVSGRKMEALQCAQDGRLWGPALVIAAQLGDQFYVDTVKQMALRQLVPGSPLRTLCLLIAGQPAEVFSSGSTNDATFPGYLNVPQHQLHFKSSSSLDNWEENLSIITANRSKDDELVITHLGDCLWKERSEIIPAHICYLMADMNFEPYSDTARLCLVGADHWKYPRTYASPEAIQRTELYEYSKTLGNPQYILLQFQPYKIIYAHMLAEVGKLSEALKYCQALLRCLKTGRSPEIETWKQFVISLEERIRAHQQRGYTVNSTPRKFVGQLLNFFDSTAQRVVGDMPPPAPHSTAGNIHLNEYNQQQEASKVPYSQSAFAIPSLMPSDLMKPSHEGVGDESRMKTQTRNVSEPDIGMTPRQDQADSLKEKVLEEVTQVKSSETVTNSRFLLFGFGILKNTVGRVLKVRSSKEAKLGDENQFYFDDKLKRWVERGVEPPAEEAALPPPPIIGAFQNNSLGSDLKNEMSPSSRSWSASSPTLSETSSVTPPISGGSNQFSARGHMGVRARYVDTFNQGRGNSPTMYRSPSGQYVKPPIPAKANFFIPTTAASPSNDQGVESVADSTQHENSADEASSAAPPPSHSFQTPTSSPMPMQRFPSADNMKRTGSGTSLKGELPPSDSRRAASWSGNLNGSFSPPSRVDAAGKLKPSPLSSCSSSAEELQDVEV